MVLLALVFLLGLLLGVVLALTLVAVVVSKASNALAVPQTRHERAGSILPRHPEDSLDGDFRSADAFLASRSVHLEGVQDELSIAAAYERQFGRAFERSPAQQPRSSSCKPCDFARRTLKRLTSGLEARASSGRKRV